MASEPLLTARQVGERLGFAPGTVVNWFEAGTIPGFRVGGRLRFRWSEVEDWLEEKRGRPKFPAGGKLEAVR